MIYVTINVLIYLFSKDTLILRLVSFWKGEIMDSRVVYTDIIDEPSEAAREIFDKLDGFVFRKNSLAIIFMEEDTDYHGLYEILSGKWDFPIIGCTAMAMITGSEGFVNEGLACMIMSADDCRFAAGVTDELTPENYQEQIARVYSGLSSELGEEEQVVLAYGVCVTEKNNVSGDDLLMATNMVCGSKPIFGGLASDELSFRKMKVFCNDKEVESGQVMALISGNIHPKYMHITSIDNLVNSKVYTITKSKDNIVYEVDGEPLMDVLEREQFGTEKTDVLRDYLHTPFVVTIEQRDGGHVSSARNLSVLDHENKSGIFLGYMPEGAKLEIGFVNRERVKATLSEVMYAMMNYVAASDKDYGTVLCTSCASRYIVISTQIKDESSMWVDRLPEGFGYLGMYSYGEFCPTTDEGSGQDYNMFHNFTYAMLAI